MTEPAGQAGQASSREEAIGARYRLERKIGSGGMATVWLARDERLHRKVAVKRLHTEAPEDAARRLSREARIGAALSHPNPVTVYDAVPEGEGVLIVMEYIDGPDLGQVLADGPPSQERTLEILTAIGSALDHLHANGVVHRDIKPSNVLIDRGGEVKLTDLGIARALADTETTQSGVMLGSVPYMSPEQLGKDEVGPPSDV